MVSIAYKLYKLSFFSVTYKLLRFRCLLLSFFSSSSRAERRRWLRRTSSNAVRSLSTSDKPSSDIPRKLRRRNSSKTDSKYSYLREVFLIGTGGNRPSLDDFDDALILRVGILLLGVVFVLIILLACAHIICISFVHFDFSKVVTRNINKRFTHIITSRGEERRRSAQPVKDDNINESTWWRKTITTTLK